MFIMDDITLENDESFGITLQRTRGLDRRITLNPVNGVVEVADNDGRYDDYMVVHVNLLYNTCFFYCLLHGRIKGATCTFY